MGEIDYAIVRSDESRLLSQRERAGICAGRDQLLALPAGIYNGHDVGAVAAGNSRPVCLGVVGVSARSAESCQSCRRVD